jgi:hypothetical protein
MWNYYKHIISKAIGYTFTRMSLYLTIFNFFMLSSWMYENTSLGDWLKSESYRIGDLMLVIIFAIFVISVLEYILIGRNHEEE